MQKFRHFGKTVATFCAFGVLTACMPGQYQSIPLPSVPVNKKQAASTADGSAADGSNPTQGSGGSSSVSTTNSSRPADSKSATGTTFAPHVPEQDALKKCLNLWGTTPFKEISANQVKVMDVSVGIGGGIVSSTLGSLGNLFNIGSTKDLEATTDPRLIVLPLSISIGGTTTFELMNPNGWYCLKAAVGAKSTVNIKLHCNAKIAQSDLGVTLNTNPTSTTSGSGLPVSVGINDGKTPGSQLGILVDSSVNLSRVNSGGGSCSP